MKGPSRDPVTVTSAGTPPVADITEPALVAEPVAATPVAPVPVGGVQAPAGGSDYVDNEPHRTFWQKMTGKNKPEAPAVPTAFDTAAADYARITSAGSWVPKNVGTAGAKTLAGTKYENDLVWDGSNYSLKSDGSLTAETLPGVARGRLEKQVSGTAFGGPDNADLQAQLWAYAKHKAGSADPLAIMSEIETWPAGSVPDDFKSPSAYANSRFTQLSADDRKALKESVDDSVAAYLPPEQMRRTMQACATLPQNPTSKDARELERKIKGSHGFFTTIGDMAKPAGKAVETGLNVLGKTNQAVGDTNNLIDGVKKLTGNEDPKQTFGLIGDPTKRRESVTQEPPKMGEANPWKDDKMDLLPDNKRERKDWTAEINGKDDKPLTIGALAEKLNGGRSV